MMLDLIEFTAVGDENESRSAAAIHGPVTFNEDHLQESCVRRYAKGPTDKVIMMEGRDSQSTSLYTR
jgi:hypothetical protein